MMLVKLRLATIAAAIAAASVALPVLADTTDVKTQSIVRITKRLS